MRGKDWYASHKRACFFCGVLIGKAAILSPEETVELGDKGVLGQGPDNLIDNLAVFKEN